MFRYAQILRTFHSLLFERILKGILFVRLVRFVGLDMLDSTNFQTTIDRMLSNATQILQACRMQEGYWEGELSSSALSTATAVGALSKVDPESHRNLITAGLEWLARNQNQDGGWGDTVLSRSNISTTLLYWSAFAMAGAAGNYSPVISAAEAWIAREAGDLRPVSLAQAVISRYGGDRTFSAPILTMCALAGRLGERPAAWKLVYPLPFEIAALPQGLLKWMRLPVVSYALPALVAIGQLRFQRLPPRNPLTRAARRLTRSRTLRLLRKIQPASGGYLEAIPLTSFVIMSLAESGLKENEVVRNGVRFLTSSIRSDGSWPIDSNLSTWVSTLAVNAGAVAEQDEDLQGLLVKWLLDQQHRPVHPYTRSPPGGWAWTDLSGGVPDTDDTSGAVLALSRLGRDDPRLAQSAEQGIAWLLQVQNRDGGLPTFCRGWGALPFDRSSPDLTAHALLAWDAWLDKLPADLRRRVRAAMRKALRYLIGSQRPEGAWEPLWFGNEQAPGEVNLTYGTARVLMALVEVQPEFGETKPALEKGAAWLLSAQNQDGGWGGAPAAPSSIEETALALDAMARLAAAGSRPAESLPAPIGRAVAWLDERTQGGTSFSPAPIGLYFARLWYFEKLYPVVFTVSALRRVAPLHLKSPRAE
ncbi:MAG: prenyltransferase/squalene oxidase repeat-containing protein [Acidobacteriota bacterium]